MGDTEMDGMDSEEETEVEKMRRRRAERFAVPWGSIDVGPPHSQKFAPPNPRCRRTSLAKLFARRFGIEYTKSSGQAVIGPFVYVTVRHGC